MTLNWYSLSYDIIETNDNGLAFKQAITAFLIINHSLDCKSCQKNNIYFRSNVNNWYGLIKEQFGKFITFSLSELKENGLKPLCEIFPEINNDEKDSFDEIYSVLKTYSNPRLEKIISDFFIKPRHIGT